MLKYSVTVFVILLLRYGLTDFMNILWVTKISCRPIFLFKAKLGLPDQLVIDTPKQGAHKIKKITKCSSQLKATDL